MATRRKGINADRLKTIYKRQNMQLWGAEYIPCILATPQEAPAISRAAILNSAKMGREIHVLSTPELKVAILALYHPNLLEIHEQRMLSTTPRLHPLSGFQGCSGVGLPPIRGVIDVAKRLGCVHLLPRVKIQNIADPENAKIVIFPYVGDFLFFMRGEDGAPYCVNCSVKDTDDDFKRNGPSFGKKPSLTEKAEVVLARHQIEEDYYQDAEIRTVRAASDQIHPHVAANLTQAFGYHSRHLEISSDQQFEILQKFRAALETGVPPLEVILLLAGSGRVSSHDCRTIFYQAIWNRELRVDLFKPVLIDHPLRPERKDVLAEYHEWFRR